VCPQKAIRERPREIGTVSEGKAGLIDFVGGRLDIGQPLAPPVIVAEPTAAGYCDFERIADLAAHFSLPAALCINKCDLDLEMAERLRSAADLRQIRGRSAS